MLTEAGTGVKLDARRRDGGPYVAAGIHAATAFLAARPDDVERVLLARDAPDELAAQAAEARVGVERVDRATLDRVAGGIPHQGIVVLGRPPRGASLDEVLALAPDLVLVLDEVTDPRNVGALLRSAEAAGVGAVLLARDRAPGLSPALVKAAAGAVECLRLVRVVNVARSVEALRDAGYWTIGLAGEAETSLFEPGAIPGLPAALVVGSEGRGIRPLVRRACHRLVRIPMLGHTRSLNVSVAAAVALYELRRATDRSVGSGRGPS